MALVSSIIQVLSSPNSTIEFLIANLNYNQLINDQLLHKAFDFYDEDKNGYISFGELRKVFMSLCTEEQLRDILREVNLPVDSDIPFSEFKKAMELVKLTTQQFKPSWSIV